MFFRRAVGVLGIGKTVKKSRLWQCGCFGTAVDNKSSLQPGFGILLDVDGVLVRGKTPIPAAKKAFQKLVDPEGHFRVPVIFVTNAGNCLRSSKADQLSSILGVPISQEQVMMSHSPLRMFREYHDKCVLVSGQGPVLDIARNLGFTNVITIDMLREAFPLLDMVDHSRRPKVLPTATLSFPKIEAIILFGEPVRWETNLQLVIDVILTSGNPGNAHQRQSRVPLFACNIDLMWMAEAQSPRFGHGTFLVCLENIYKKITGEELKYEGLMGKPSELTYQYAEYLIRTQTAKKQSKPIKTLYAVGDNLMTDIYGANLYSQYLEKKSVLGSKTLVQAKVAAGKGATTAAVSQEEDPETPWENELASPSATSCRSVLVCTGIYNPHAQVPANCGEYITETVFHGHRDFKFDPALVEPSHIVEDVNAAIELIFQLENFIVE